MCQQASGVVGCFSLARPGSVLQIKQFQVNLTFSLHLTVLTAFLTFRYLALQHVLCDTCSLWPCMLVSLAIPSCIPCRVVSDQLVLS